jgi:subtilisin family serine protease
MAAIRKLIGVVAIASAAAGMFVAHPTPAAFAPNDPLWPEQWGAIAVGAPAAWTAQASSPVVIAVVDTAIDATHPDLAAKIDPGFDTTPGASAEGTWHGTAVASIAAGASNNGVGITSYCWNCRVLPVTVLDRNGDGADRTIATGIRWAVDHGARVVNVSLAGATETPPLRRAIAYAVASGVVVVAAAGNERSSEPAYPAADAHVIAVAAANPHAQLYPWSNRGRWITVAAPGVNLAAVPGGGYFAFEGTSSAAPVVSGIVGLCLSAAPSLTPTQVHDALVHGATPMRGLGFGEVDAAATVRLCRRTAADAQ